MSEVTLSGEAARREEDWHSPVRFTILDTRTGVTGVEARVGVYQMMEGNFSCDCNRSMACWVDEITLRWRYGEGRCRGNKTLPRDRL